MYFPSASKCMLSILPTEFAESRQRKIPFSIQQVTHCVVHNEAFKPDKLFALATFSARFFSPIFLPPPRRPRQTGPRDYYPWLQRPLFPSQKTILSPFFPTDKPFLYTVYTYVLPRPPQFRSPSLRCLQGGFFFALTRHCVAQLEAGNRQSVEGCNLLPEQQLTATLIRQGSNLRPLPLPFCAISQWKEGWPFAENCRYTSIRATLATLAFNSCGILFKNHHNHV